MLNSEATGMHDILEAKLRALGIDGEVAALRRGPSVTTVLIRPAARTRVSSIQRSVVDLSVVFGGRVRVLAPFPGTALVGIEVLNQQRETVWLEALLNEMNTVQYQSPLVVPIGVDTFGGLFTADLRKFPHLLVAGASGSGKSNFLHTLILSLMYRIPYQRVHLLLIDTKSVEFSLYAAQDERLAYLLCPVVTDAKIAIGRLEQVVAEVESRYARMAKRGVRHASQLDEPDIVVVIDELADLLVVGKKALALLIQRIAQKARAAGVHLVVATRRPSVDVVSGVIKANLPARLAFRLPSANDSRTILDVGGAEHLLGEGDALLQAPGIPLTRLQAPFVSEKVMGEILQGAPHFQRLSWWRRLVDRLK